MKVIKRTTFLAMAAVVAVACGPAEDRVGEWTDDDEAREVTPEMRAQFAALRSEVDSVLNDLRAEVEASRAEVGDQPPERWAEVTTRVEETRGEVMTDMERLQRADLEEAHRIRDRASERIAELEAEIIRNELEAVRDAQTLASRVDEKLSSLESDLAEIRARVAERPRDPAADPERDRGVTDRVRAWINGSEIDERDVENLRDELMEVRQEAAEIPERVRDDDFEGVRDDLSGSVADLTRDVRKHWYALRWDAPHAEMRHPRDEGTPQYDGR